MDDTKFKSIDEYIGSFPPEIRERLSQLSETIRAAAPEAEEKISYNMPTFSYQGYLLYFAAAKNHIGLYGVSAAVLDALPEAAARKTSKGTLQLPHKDPLPLDLIRRIVELRLEENRAKAAARAR